MRVSRAMAQFSTFVFFDLANLTTESGIDLQCPSPIMAPGSMCCLRVVFVEKSYFVTYLQTALW